MSQKFECRICYDEEKIENKLIHPCACDGTNRYVHRKCLDEWRFFGDNPEIRKRCMECQQKYIFDFMHSKEEYEIHIFSQIDVINQIIYINIALMLLSLCINIIDNYNKNIVMKHLIDIQKIDYLERLVNSDLDGLDGILIYIAYLSYFTLFITSIAHVASTTIIYYKVKRKKDYFSLTKFTHILNIILSLHFSYTAYLPELLQADIFLLFIGFFNFINVFFFHSIFDNHNDKLNLLNSKFNKRIVKNLNKKMTV